MIHRNSLRLLFATFCLSALHLTAAFAGDTESTPAANSGHSPAAPLPPMGWNSWNKFHTKITEKIVRETADAMVASGMKEAGYEYIVIDDSWQYGRVPRSYVSNVEPRAGRDTNGELMADPERFPSGIKALADYVHGKGLKFGIYTAPGVATCAGHTGSFGHEEKDVQTFARWGVDYLKLDDCGHTEEHEVVLARWRAAIDRAGRPLVLSVNISRDFAMVRRYADLWRTTTDIKDVFQYAPEEFRVVEDVCTILDQMTHVGAFHGQGRWNDPDMLQVGNGKMTADENRAHFGMWAILAAPLMAGNDLRTMTPELREILTNREVIAINQDPAGIQGYPVLQLTPHVQVWVKPLQKANQLAVAVLNVGKETTTCEVPLSPLGLRGEAHARDLFARKDLGLIRDKLSVTVPSNGILLVKLSGFEYVTPPQVFVPKTLDFAGGSARVEAEDVSFIRFYVGNVTQTLPGFSGTGCVLGKNHSWARFRFRLTLPLSEGGLYHCTLRYQNPGTTPLNYSFDSNATVTFAPTAPGQWQTITVPLQLKAGMNILNLSAPACDRNELALDYFELSQKR